jgi:hypothetical protein
MLVTAELLIGYGPPFLEYRFHAQRFSSHRALKNHIAGKRFVTDADVKRAVISCLLTVDTDFFYAGIHNVTWCNGGTNPYMSVMTTLASDVYHLLPMCCA